MVRIEAKGNDIDRRLLMRSGSRCFLLKRGKETSQFVVIVELIKGWKVVYDNFRDQMTLIYADVAKTFGDQVAQASWIAFGVPNDDDKIDVYTISQDRRDVVPPVANDANWKLHMTYSPRDRFTIVS